ncbi:MULTISPECIES: hypothetical protein [unclassified Paraburkholderia]|uniref:hypothetical protein n=1 Tax=unclassified Paraburkholderia TaxID=2615204 RepID=UPI002AAF6CE7|nr:MULTISPECIES: hypothetical protein [unclassified Paraburkholderia]
MTHALPSPAPTSDLETGYRQRFPGAPADTVAVQAVQAWLDVQPPLYPSPLQATAGATIAAWLYRRSVEFVQRGLQSLDTRHWNAARELCRAADTLIASGDAATPAPDTRYGSSPRPARERAGRLFATIAHARLDLLAMPDSIARTGLSNALDDAELLARDVIDNPVPAYVLDALDRMCTPLDESITHGPTAIDDARAMETIRAYVLGDNTESEA